MPLISYCTAALTSLSDSLSYTTFLFYLKHSCITKVSLQRDLRSKVQHLQRDLRLEVEYLMLLFPNVKLNRC